MPAGLKVLCNCSLTLLEGFAIFRIRVLRRETTLNMFFPALRQAFQILNKALDTHLSVAASTEVLNA